MLHVDSLMFLISNVILIPTIFDTVYYLEIHNRNRNGSPERCRLLRNIVNDVLIHYDAYKDDSFLTIRINIC